MVYGYLLGYCMAGINEKKLINSVDRVLIFGRITSHRDAGIAQLVEHNLAKVGVASSSLVSRSKLKRRIVAFFLKHTSNSMRLCGRVVMQRPAKPCTPVRFRPQPPYIVCPGGETGRRKGLKIPRW